MTRKQFEKEYIRFAKAKTRLEKILWDLPYDLKGGDAISEEESIQLDAFKSRVYDSLESYKRVLEPLAGRIYLKHLREDK